LAAIFAPLACATAREGTPLYYQTIQPGQQFTVRQNPGQQPVFVGNQQSSSGPVIGQNVQSQVFQVPRQGTGSSLMTPAGVALDRQTDWTVYAYAGRRFADFTFETGVQSVLNWNDMVYNEITGGVRRDFKMRDFDLFVFGEYSNGSYVSGGLSMDYDLKPYDNRYPEYGLFTISIGDQTGALNRIKFGLGAWRIWDVLGWKISPIVGYEILHHDLQMSNHEYPNPATYIPLLTEYGDYVIGNQSGQYTSVQQGMGIPDGWYQVCVGPEDIAIVVSNPDGTPAIDGQGNLIMTGYDPIMGDLPWGVPGGNCVIIGGDGMIVVEGTTHIYNTTWSGIYLALELEKQMTYTDKLRFYGQVSMPRYSSEGIWPNRTDWQQNPSFIDEGSTDSIAYRLEMEYTYHLNENLHLNLKADWDYFFVGAISGTLFVNEYSTYVIDQYGQYVVDPITGYPIIETVPAHELHIQDSLKWAKFQSFGLNVGLKYLF
jgi:hypothetical protein